jgi:hypothetical protein
MHAGYICAGDHGWRQGRTLTHECCPCSCTLHLQYVPVWALLGLIVMIAGCATFGVAVRALVITRP